MALNPHSPRGAVRSEINVTPLVDVCLVLLIIFMVMTPLIQAGIKVDLPKTAKSHSMPGQGEQLTVTVQEDGSVWVSGRQTPEADLPGLLATLHQAQPDRTVIVRGDRRLQYEKITEVLATLSDVGFTRIGLVTEKKRS
ncbi:MAG TPA: biopolymer transporter ExbD [Thermoanaerobaculia bacterium]